MQTSFRTNKTIIPFNQQPLKGLEKKEVLEKIRTTKELVNQKLETFEKSESLPQNQSLVDASTSGKAEFKKDGEALSFTMESGEGNGAKEYHFRSLPNGGKLYAAPMGEGKWGVEHFIMVENGNGTVHIAESGSAGGPLQFAMNTTRDISYGERYMFS